MVDSIRELLRAAQAAELSGDKRRAAERLMEAAALYRGSGKGSRAAQMIRHALRLEPDREDLRARLAALEAAESSEAVGAVHVLEMDAASVSGEGPPGLASGPGVQRRGNLDAPPRSAIHPRFQRGPVLADPALDAWCSFCCCPRAEVGALVAGPAGAFICAACAGESSALLWSDPGPGPRPRPHPKAKANASRATARKKKSGSGVRDRKKVRRR